MTSPDVPEKPTASNRDDEPVFALHRGGKMEIVSTVPLRDRDDLSLAYTPGVAEVCTAIAADPALAWDYTWKSNVVAVVTDGTAVLGLGDIGPLASLPVMEGKAVLFKQFGGVDAVPICLDCTDVDELVETVVRLAPASAGSTSRTSARRAASRSSGGSRARWTSRSSTTTSTARRSCAGRAAQRGPADRPHARRPARGGVRRRRGGRRHRRRSWSEAGIGDIAVADCKGIVHAGPHRPDPDQARWPRSRTRPGSPGRSRRRWSAPTSTSGCRRARSPRRPWRRLAPDCIIFAMANPTPEIHPDVARQATPRWSRPAAATSPTRSTTCWPSRASSRGALDVRASAITEA